MRELFLTATVKHGDFENACAILQGLTWMSARHAVYRILLFAGQPQPKGLSNQRTFRMSPLLAFWNELGKQLVRSSYILQLVYEVSPDQHFGKGTAMDFNSLPGTLRWTDLPDPLRDTPVTQRKKIEIPDHKNLVTTMADNNHTYKHEMVEERYSFVRENVEFVFYRYYHLPESPGRPVTTLPAFADLRPLDAAQKWVLNVKLNVLDDTQPEKMKKANEEIMAVKAELEKLFEFRSMDRRCLDTRIAAPPVVPGRV